LPQPADDNIGEEAKKAVREAVAAHSSHLTPGIDEPLIFHVI
jgi:hypothetical protein